MDRRTVWAILLMMVIAIAPMFLMKQPPRGAAGQRGSGADSSKIVPPSAAHDSVRSLGDSVTVASGAQDSVRANPAAPLPRRPAAAAAPPDDTVRVASPLYTYGISTRGGRLVEARLSRYRSMA